MTALPSASTVPLCGALLLSKPTTIGPELLNFTKIIHGFSGNKDI